MKKLFFAAIIAVFTMTSVNAQKFGAKAGLNIANVALSGDNVDTSDLKSKIGFNFGGFAEFEISDKFSFQPELLFSTQGYKTEGSYNDVDFLSGNTIKVSYESTTSLNYLNIPLMAKYYVAEGFSIQAGPQVGFLLSADYEESETIDGETETVSGDVKKYYNSVDFALDFGLGYQMDSGLYFDARYNLGLADIIKDRDSGDDGKEKNNVISISVGYFFN